MVEPLSQQLATVIAVAPADGVAAQTAITGTILDMQAYGADRVLITVIMGAITAGAVTSLKVSASDADDMGDPVDITGSAQTIAADKDGKIFQVDLINVVKRYIQLSISRGTQDAAVAAALYQVYGIRNKPVTQGSDVATLEIHRDKVGGTA